jgi:hypothetical protein
MRAFGHDGPFATLFWSSYHGRDTCVSSAPRVRDGASNATPINKNRRAKSVKAADIEIK